MEALATGTQVVVDLTQPGAELVCGIRGFVPSRNRCRRRGDTSGETRMNEVPAADFYVDVYAVHRGFDLAVEQHRHVVAERTKSPVQSLSRHMVQIGRENR